MIDLSSFGDNLQVAVIGASGGIGRGFIEHFQECEQVEKIYAFSRSSLSFDNAKVTSGIIDLEDEESIEAAADSVVGKCDIIITATGILHGDSIAPEKTLRNLDAETIQAVLNINYVGPSLVGKYFLPLLPREGRSVFAMLSARVGSISDNMLGGWYSYRASKAALNMFIKTASIETARKHKEAVLIALHPGTVETNLSEPFQGNVPTGKLFTAEYSTEQMINVMNTIEPSKSGLLFAYDGEEVAP